MPLPPSKDWWFINHQPLTGWVHSDTECNPRKNGSPRAKEEVQILVGALNTKLGVHVGVGSCSINYVGATAPKFGAIAPA